MYITTTFLGRALRPFVYIIASAMGFITPWNFPKDFKADCQRKVFAVLEQ